METTIVRDEKKLDPEFKKKWVAALRSGEYKQGEGLLRSQDHEGKDYFCCLGVACVVVGSKDIPAVEFIGETVYRNAYSDDGEAYLPQGIPDLLVGDNETTRVLAVMNDGDPANEATPKSFSEIADYIEENL